MVSFSFVNVLQRMHTSTCLQLLVLVMVLFLGIVQATVFSQTSCDDSGCENECSVLNLPASECIPASGGGSVVVTCFYRYLEYQQYLFTQDCTGFVTTERRDLDVCYEADDGGYVKYECYKGDGRRAQAKRISTDNQQNGTFVHSSNSSSPRRR
jgi:hypothetical protein